MQFVELKNRSLIFINGKDQRSFLQGLITNDINKIDDTSLIYSLMLNPQGRFLYEFFISKYQDGLIIDISKDLADSFLKKLSFYKLRSDVNLEKITDKKAFFISKIKDPDPKFYPDPRGNLGCRFYGSEEELLEKKSDLTKENLDFYHSLRINEKIIDENDLTHDKSIISEFDFDQLQAINYQKGCYIGQELVARSHYKGKLRKKVFLIEIANQKELEKNSEITCAGKKQGIVLSSINKKDKFLALALIKNIDNSDNEINLFGLDLFIGEEKIKIIK